MYTTGRGGYLAEKAESETGWLFPVGDEVNELGYNHMFSDMFDAMDSGRQPAETFYDGYIVNAIMDACYQSAETRQWEPVKLDIWHGEGTHENEKSDSALIDGKYHLIKEERMPGGELKQILKDINTGEVVERMK